MAQVAQADMPAPPQIDRLMERSKTEIVPPKAPVVDKMNDNIRSLEEVCIDTKTSLNLVHYVRLVCVTSTYICLK